MCTSLKKQQLKITPDHLIKGLIDFVDPDSKNLCTQERVGNRIEMVQNLTQELALHLSMKLFES